MNKLSAKDNILQQLKSSEQKRSNEVIDLPSYTYKDFFVWDNKTIVETFCTEFQKVTGVFIECNNTENLIDKLKSYLTEKNEFQIFSCEETVNMLITKTGFAFKPIPKYIPAKSISITTCEYLIAQSGTIMISSALTPGRKGFIFPDIHIVIANFSQLLWDLETALIKIQEKYRNNLPSLISFVTGPSRTADIEKTLVLGAHGPREIVVLFNNSVTSNEA